MTLSLVNVCSVRPKGADLLDLLCDMKSDVICLTETWLTPDDVAARSWTRLAQVEKAVVLLSSMWITYQSVVCAVARNLHFNTLRV